MNLDAPHLLELQMEALFRHDSAGRIRTINEPGGGPAPRFFLGRTRAGNRWRFRDDLADGTVRRLEALAADEPVHDDLRAEPRHLAAFLAALRADREVRSIASGPAYRFPDALPAPPRATPSHVTRITPATLSLLRRLGWDLEALAREFEEREPMVAVVEAGEAVAVCFCSRLTARAAEAGVETLAAYRGRGHAPAVVAAWAAAVRAAGRIPLYSTAWENLASRAVARKLGLIQYGADLSLG